MNKLEMDKVAERFRKTRIDLDMNQQKFAEELNVSQSVISDIERGHREPSRPILVHLAEKYEVDLNWLLIGKSITEDDASEKKIKKLEEQIKRMDNLNNDLEKKNADLTKELLDRMRDLYRLQNAENSAAL